MSRFPQFTEGRKPPTSARQWQNLSDAAEGFANLQVQAPLTMMRHGRIAMLGIRREAPKGAIIQAFTLTVMRDDYMEALAADGIKTLFIAKPYLLQRTPFDIAEVPAPAARLGVTYEYTDSVTRIATRGEETENQIVIPQYVAGDMIFAIRTIFGGTGVVTGDPLPGLSVSWLDLNVDGREWAKVSG